MKIRNLLYITLFSAALTACDSGNPTAKSEPSSETQTHTSSTSNTKKTSPKHVPTAQGFKGKVFCGYQGWYRAPGDGSELGFKHYESYSRKFEPGICGIDYWPDMSETSKEEQYPTPFKHADGSEAKVFSSQNPKTVNRHFKWMKQHGIDGIFLQRFVVDVAGGNRRKEKLYNSNNIVLQNCQAGAKEHGRAYSLMYDLSGCKPDGVLSTWKDWQSINKKYKITDDPNYIRHNGKPVIAIWGVGFSDGRAYGVKEVSQLIEKFRQDGDNEYAILLGVPTYWRDGNRDSIPNEELYPLLEKADIILPWAVTRFRDPKGAKRYATTQITKDLEWCKKNNLDYLPVAFPGFSWANRKNLPDKFNFIPRLGGSFLWSQAIEYKNVGINSMYIAMFDEMDEGTQIFKVSNNPPVGASKFLKNDPSPPDFYLRLTGEIGRLLRGEVPAKLEMPIKPNN